MTSHSRIGLLDRNKKIRVLVVDDSLLMRHTIGRILSEAGIHVIGYAKDGEEGLEKIADLQPDVVTLDVEMPRMDGMTMLRRLMETNPIPVVMVSTLTQRNAPAAIEALQIGAVDIVGKPGGPYANASRLREVGQELVLKVKAAADAKLALNPGAPKTGISGKDLIKTIADRPPRRSSGIVVIGSSTGGPRALSTIFSALPGDFPWPIIVVQHMPAGFTRSLAQRLDSLSELSVAEAIGGHLPEPGEAWVAPGGMHLRFDQQKRMQLFDGPPHLGVRPGVDLALESAAEVWGKGTIAIILTGMGKDGTRGARKVKQVGGKVFTQSESTCVVYGMPRSVYEMGLSDQVVDLEDVASVLTQLAEAHSR